MANETERKFLVFAKAPLKGLRGARIVQGYLQEKGVTTRIRIVDSIEGFLTLKGARRCFTRPEYEYSIPLQDAQELLAMRENRVLTKTRYEVPNHGHVWHLDVFTGALQGLVTAEVELGHDYEVFALPSWLGPEVTFDKAYTNKRLAIEQRIPMRLAA